MIGNNACGSHSVAWGKTVDNVVGLDVLTYRGDRLVARGGRFGRRPGCVARRWASGSADDVRAGFPDLTRRVSGYNLDQLLPGRVDLAKALVGHRGHVRGADRGDGPAGRGACRARALAVLGFPDAYTAADHVMVVRALNPLTIEGMDAGLIAALRASQSGRDGLAGPARGRRLALRRDRRGDPRRGARRRGGGRRRDGAVRDLLGGGRASRRG